MSCAEQPLVEAYLDRQQDGHPAEREPWLYFDRIESDFVRDSQNLAIGKMLKDADYLCLRAHEAKMSAQAFENMALSQLVEGVPGSHLVMRKPWQMHKCSRLRCLTG